MDAGIFMLCLGLALWMSVHFIPSLAPDWRAAWIARLGLGGWKGLFSVLVISALVLIVLGWRATPPLPVYVPADWGRKAAIVLMYPALFLFIAAQLPTNMKRWLRHPLLAGVVLWAVAHLLANGEARSVLLFVTLGAWALLEMVTISRHKGPWERPAPVSAARDVMVAGIAVVAYGVLLHLHRYFTGVPLVGG